MIEIETKYTLGDRRSEVEEKLKSLGFADSGTIYQKDIVFLPKHVPSFSEFKKGEPIMRIRILDNSVLITMKKDLDKEGTCKEIEFGVSDSIACHEMLEELGFHKITEVEKRRTSYHLEGNPIAVELDSVTKLGNYMEIEVVSADESLASIEKIKEDIAQFAERLGFSESEKETRKYDRLMKELEIK